MFNHYLITRFNLRLKDWQHTRNGAEVLTESWLNERFRLFDDYCLPSVKNQSNQNFKWCVFFDVETPLIYKDKIANTAANYSNFIPIYIDDMEYLNRSFISFIEDSLLSETKMVVTTRLDNDDIIHKDFIETIQNEFPLVAETVIDLRKGYQVSIESSGTQIRTIDFPLNQFVSYVEATEKPIITVMDKMHREWKNNPLVQVFTEKELWIELIHDSNKLNSVRKTFQRTYDFKNEDFGIKKSLHFKESKIGVFITNLSMDFEKFKHRVAKKLKIK